MTASGNSSDEKPRRRRGKKAGGRGKVAPTGQAAIPQKPFSRLRYSTPPVNLISEDELDSIHVESLRVLSELGIRVLHDSPRCFLSEKWTVVEEGTEMMRFDLA